MDFLKTMYTAIAEYITDIIVLAFICLLYLFEDLSIHTNMKRDVLNWNKTLGCSIRLESCFPNGVIIIPQPSTPSLTPASSGPSPSPSTDGVENRRGNKKD